MHRRWYRLRHIVGKDSTMQLLRTPVTNGPDWLASKPLPKSLPAPSPVEPLRSYAETWVGRVGKRNQTGTSSLTVGIGGVAWTTHGSFEQAVAAARDLSKALPVMWNYGPPATEVGTIGVIQAKDGWELFRAGLDNSDDTASSPFNFIPATGATPTVIRPTSHTLLAVVSPTRWVDLRPKR
jgi:hypothetical protein